MRIEALGLFGNRDKSDLHTAVTRIRELCAEQNVTVHLADALDPSGLSSADLVQRVDVVVALGGDGTMLQAARSIGRSGVPLLGINLGSLGYLTDVRLEELDDAIRRLLCGAVRVDRRSQVAGVVERDGERLAAVEALNDLVVNMGSLPRALDLELVLDGESLGCFLGDGMIFSTPTGSTAYNLSAGGPICQPELACLLITPICPHTLGMRPLIVSSDMNIELILHDAGEGATLTADGQSATHLRSGDRIRVALAPTEVSLVKFPNSNAYRVMRHKLGWGAPARRRGG
jgi:NAD+ kinase